MKEQIKTIYRCDHCDKIMFRKGSMTYHEKLCYKNPVNIALCLSCKFSEKKAIVYIYDGNDGFGYKEWVKPTNCFHCPKHNIDMYPFKAVKMGLLKRFPDQFEDQEPMKMECEHYVRDFEKWIP